MEPTLHHELAHALPDVYGSAEHTQRTRYTAALRQFRHDFGPGPVAIYRAPGRVNLIGEHTDYNHGFVLPAALDKDVLLLARPRTDGQFHIRNFEVEFRATEFVLGDAITPADKGHWSNYVRGAAQMVVQQALQAGLGMPPGLDVLVAGAAPDGVPRGAGLSSSSALVVATAVALADHTGWRPDRRRLAHLCADAEWYVGTRGGMMDHFASLLSRRDHALFLDCRPQAGGAYHTSDIPIPAGTKLVVVDSGVHHDNVRGEYNRRVAACRAGVALLADLVPGATHLRDFQPIPWTVLEAYLPETKSLGELNAQGVNLGELPGVEPDEPLRIRACCRHVWHENARVLETLDALQAGDLNRAGRLLHVAHSSARLDYAISTPELDALTAVAEEIDGVYGARLTGAGWGGCVVVLVAASATEALQDRLAQAYAGHFGYRPAMFICQPGPGAGRVATLELA